MANVTSATINPPVTTSSNAAAILSTFYTSFQILNLVMIAPSVSLFLCITVTIFSSEKLRENSRYVLFANLLACDTSFLLSATVILTMIWRQTGLSLTSCNVNTIVSTILNESGVLCVTLMSVERYVAICHPLHHPRWFNRHNTLASLAVIWLVSSIFPLASGIMVFVSGVTQNVTRTCSSYTTNSLMPNPVAIAVLREFPNAVIFTLSFSVLIFTYWNIMLAARKASDRSSKAIRAKRTVIIHGLQLILYLCTLGNALFEMLFHQIVSDTLSLTILRTSHYLFLYYSSRFVVPLIYGIRDKSLRQQIKKILSCHYNRVATF